MQDEARLFRVIRAAFGQRRKTLANSLAGAGFGKEAVRGALARAGVEETRRAEELSLAEFAAVADALGA